VTRTNEDDVLPGEIARLHPAQGVVLRRFDLGSPEIDPVWAASLLDAEETARAARYVRPDQQARARASRALLRSCLAPLIGRAPDALHFAIGEHGKPSLTGGPEFSVSHSADRFLVAVSEHGELGVDVELPATPRNLDAAARWAFTSDEVAALDRLDEIIRKRAFLRVWTAKEAALKALGVGLQKPMRTLSLAPEGLDRLGDAFWRPATIATEAERMALTDVSVQDDIACLALRQV
jgi:4'-phosphopantetheinyl transferase